MVYISKTYEQLQLRTKKKSHLQSKRSLGPKFTAAYHDGANTQQVCSVHIGKHSICKEKTTPVY